MSYDQDRAAYLLKQSKTTIEFLRSRWFLQRHEFKDNDWQWLQGIDLLLIDLESELNRLNKDLPTGDANDYRRS